jgi:hypothetical protein
MRDGDFEAVAPAMIEMPYGRAVFHHQARNLIHEDTQLCLKSQLAGYEKTPTVIGVFPDASWSACKKPFKTPKQCPW